MNLPEEPPHTPDTVQSELPRGQFRCPFDDCGTILQSGDGQGLKEHLEKEHGSVKSEEFKR